MILQSIENTNLFIPDTERFSIMKCVSCGKESSWTEIIGTDFVCIKCVQKHKVLRLVHNRHLDTFRSVLKKLDVKNYADYMKITREQLEKIVNFEKIGIKLKTTNIVDLE